MSRGKQARHTAGHGLKGRQPNPSASGFTRQLEGHYGMRHDRIPPHCSTYNSDVETLHNLIEREFYDIETFESLAELLGKAFAYQLYFNYQRPNTWREGKSPSQLLRELAPDLSPKVLTLPPGSADRLSASSITPATMCLIVHTAPLPQND